MMNQATTEGKWGHLLDPNYELTAWDYMNAPITLLVQSPNYSLERWTRLASALGEAQAIIQRALDMGSL